MTRNPYSFPAISASIPVSNVNRSVDVCLVLNANLKIFDFLMTYRENRNICLLDSLKEDRIQGYTILSSENVRDIDQNNYEQFCFFFQ